ncbi:MAG: IclR family transcriptional regulator [Chloroflexi bacterium]|nr:IclR family transcriptional regulator [Chloroflexota bacterium]
MSQTPPSKALSRGLAIIALLAGKPNGMKLSEIARQVGISKSSTYRLLQTLIQDGFATQDEDSSRYRLTLKFLWLVSDLIEGLGLDHVVRSTLEELGRVTGETIHMALLDGTEAVYVEKIDSPNSIRMYSRIGKRIPLHCTGLGKAILAYLPERTVREIIATQGLPQRTPNTITDERTLFEHLQRIREQGYALDEEEHEKGIRCIATPLFDHNNQVVGAISIAALAFRVDQEQLLSWQPQLQASAQKITSALQNHFLRAE